MVHGGRYTVVGLIGQHASKPRHNVINVIKVVNVLHLRQATDVLPAGIDDGFVRLLSRSLACPHYP